MDSSLVAICVNAGLNGVDALDTSSQILAVVLAALLVAACGTAAAPSTPRRASDAAAAQTPTATTSVALASPPPDQSPCPGYVVRCPSVIAPPSLAVVESTSAKPASATTRPKNKAAKASPRATARPTARPAPKPSPRPTPRPTPVPTEKPKPASNCHPSYRGACLIGGIGDYDCAAGSGNGPNYVAGPIDVVGYDEFGLDRDGDGVGCENG